MLAKFYPKIKELGGKELVFLLTVGVITSALLIVEREINTAKEGVQAESAFVEGTLVKSAESPAVYVVTGQKRKHVPSPQIFESRGYQWERIRTVSKKELETLPEINLLKTAGDTNLYYAESFQKRVINSDEVLASYGLSKNDAFLVEKQEIDAYPTARLLKKAGDEKVYYIDQAGLRRHIPTAQVFESYGNKWYNIVTVTHEELVNYPITHAVKLSGGTKVYYLAPGKSSTKKHWIKDPSAFNRLGIKWDQIAPVNATEFNAYPEGESIGAGDIIQETPGNPVLSRDEQKIQDALSRGVAINPQNDVLLKNSRDYQIFYIVNSKTFLVSILSSNFSGTKATAESDLFSLLGVSTSTFCALTIEITTPRYANPSLAGQVFKPSLCP